MIKFRVYDLKENKYVPNDVDWLITSDGKLYKWDCDDEPEELSQKRFVAEQGTGLKDKNGKEIYDGDIVKIARSYGYGFLPKGAKAKIEFDEKELCCKLRGNGEFRLTSKKEVEVIGNIHENPELLEEKKCNQ